MGTYFSVCTVYNLRGTALSEITALPCGTDVQMLIMDLTDALELYPPPQPTRPAVDLLVTVGKHQEYLDHHGLLPSQDHAGSLDALKVSETLLLALLLL